MCHIVAAKSVFKPILISHSRLDKIKYPSIVFFHDIYTCIYYEKRPWKMPPVTSAQFRFRARQCSWSSADRRRSNYIWVINNIIAYKAPAYITGLNVVLKDMGKIFQQHACLLPRGFQEFHQPWLVIRTFHHQGRCSRGGHLCNEHSEEKYSCIYK